MGSKITKLQPVGGFAAETSAAISILIATQTGVPVSTTHAITGAIVGVGATRRLSAVRWGVADADRLGMGPDHPRGVPDRRRRLLAPPPRRRELAAHNGPGSLTTASRNLAFSPILRIHDGYN